MEPAARLSLPSILRTLPLHVVLRLDAAAFPAYGLRSDLDVLVERGGLDASVRAIDSAVAPPRQLRVHALVPGVHLHADVVEATGELHFRFDLYTALPYTRFSLHPGVYGNVLAHRERRDSAWVPRLQDDLALRYAEYVEHKDTRPDKIKHLRHVEQHADVAVHRVKEGDTNSTLGYPACQPTPFGILLWGHGAPHLCAVLELLHRHVASCQVLHVRRVEPNHLSAFLQLVYAADLGPGSAGLHGHIRDKTRYLEGVPRACVFVLLRKPYARMEGGEFDQDLVAFKWAVRRQFNPRDDAHPAVAPLPRGVTHHHVVHAMDRLRECEPICRAITGHDVKHFEHRNGVPYHLGPAPQELRAVHVPILHLRANLIDAAGLVPLVDTPHAAFLRGDEEPYRTYYAAHAGTSFVDGHSPACFRALIHRFAPDAYAHDPRQHILVTPRGGGAWQIVDGVHRAAILAHHFRDPDTRLPARVWRGPP